MNPRRITCALLSATIPNHIPSLSTRKKDITEPHKRGEGNKEVVASRGGRVGLFFPLAISYSQRILPIVVVVLSAILASGVSLMLLLMVRRIVVVIQPSTAATSARVVTLPLLIDQGL